MEIWKHSLFSIFLAIVFYPLFKMKTLVILISGILIDIDHYILYIWKTKNFNIVKCHKYFTTEALENDHKHIMGKVLVFHNVEFILLVALLCFYSQLAFIFLIGLLGHYLLDFIWFGFIYKRFVLNPSIICWLIKKSP